MRFAAMALVALLAQEKVLLEEKFAAKPGPGWSWVREDAGAWKVEGGALHIKSLPGKIWYKTKTAKNFLTHKVPAAGTAEAPVSVEVTLESAPEITAEQAGLYLHFDDANFVKIIRENVKGKVQVLLVREQKNVPEPLTPKEESAGTVRLRLTWAGGKVSGAYKTTGDWVPVGEVEVPAGVDGANVGLASHGGAPDADRWAKFTALRIVQGAK